MSEYTHKELQKAARYLRDQYRKETHDSKWGLDDWSVSVPLNGHASLAAYLCHRVTGELYRSNMAI